MSFESSISVTNSANRSVILYLEPWGDQFEMLPATTLCLIARAVQPGSFEIEHLEDEIIVWAWTGSVVSVFSEGNEACILNGDERPPVPEVPEGQSVSGFLRTLLGKDRSH